MRVFTCTVSLLIIASKSIAQEPTDHLKLYEQTQENIISVYKDKMGVNLGLYNGSEYQYSGHNVKGFPYFKSADTLQGSVFYDGNLYDNVPMYYDLVNDELVILNYSKDFPIKLVTDKITYFIIDKCKFLKAGKSDLTLPGSSGFYEELYNNKTGIFAKKEKILRLSAKAEDNTASYVEYRRYFIYADNKMHEVSNEKSVLKVFQKRKSDLKKFIHVNNLDFKKNFEEAIVKTAQQFDQIGN